MANSVIGASNIDGPRLAALFVFCCCAYLTVYSVEAPIRYGLFLSGHDSLIFIRDGLMITPMLVLFAAHAQQLRVHPAFVVAGLLIILHGLVLVGTTGSVTGVVYGVKVLMNLLVGFFAASLLLSPGRRTFGWLAFLWLVILVGVFLDKFVMSFPWTGIKTVIGDLSVDVSKDWEIQDGFAKRVAGFTRSSIAVASIMPCLSIVLLCKIKERMWRLLIAALAVGVVLLTTQKGSLIAFTPIALILCAAPEYRANRLRWAAGLYLILAIALPVMTVGLHMEHGAGVFSTESLFLRVAYTWPEAWHWIDRHQMLWFGVGLGGIGAPQRLYAPDNFNPADNVFLLLFAYFGVFTFLYGGWIGHLMLRPVTGSPERMVPALAIVAFALGYGVVLSILEDQSASLFLGAAIGVLWRETIPVRDRVGDRYYAEQSGFTAGRNRYLRPRRL